MKWFDSTGLTVADNEVHHNEGPGLWTDINNINTIYEQNNAHNNTSHGIFHEISYSAIIRNNRIVDNGGGQRMSGWGDAGIRVAASPNVEVYGNILIGNTMRSCSFNSGEVTIHPDMDLTSWTSSLSTTMTSL